MLRKTNEDFAMKYPRKMASFDQYFCELAPKNSSERIFTVKSHMQITDILKVFIKVYEKQVVS